MEREDRYIVIKKVDYDAHLSKDGKAAFLDCLASIAEGREREGRSPTDYVVVGGDWPMYEDTWKSIEKWVDGMDAAKNEIKPCPLCGKEGVMLLNKRILCKVNKCVQAQSLEIWNSMLRTATDG